jgi:hypothetical protein
MMSSVAIVVFCFRPFCFSLAGWGRKAIYEGYICAAIRARQLLLWEIEQHERELRAELDDFRADALRKLELPADTDSETNNTD